MRADGYWQYGLCECFKFGCFHPSFVLALCFNPCLWAQIMTRVNLTCLASPGTPKQVSGTFKKIFTLVVLVVLAELFFGYEQELDPLSNRKIIKKNNFGIGLGVVSFLFVLLIASKTRAAIRKKYNITPSYCGPFEDCCCVLFCGCCTASQMAKETVDYETTPSSCCSKNGIDRPIPIMLV